MDMWRLRPCIIPARVARGRVPPPLSLPPPWPTCWPGCRTRCGWCRRALISPFNIWCNWSSCWLADGGAWVGPCCEVLEPWLPPPPPAAANWPWLPPLCVQKELQGRQGSNELPSAPPKAEPRGKLRGVRPRKDPGDARVPVVPDEVVTVAAPVGCARACELAGPDWLAGPSSVGADEAGAPPPSGWSVMRSRGGGRSLMTAVEMLSMVMEPGPSSMNTTGLCAVSRAGPPVVPKGPPPVLGAVLLPDVGACEVVDVALVEVVPEVTLPLSIRGSVVGCGGGGLR